VHAAPGASVGVHISVVESQNVPKSHWFTLPRVHDVPRSPLTQRLPVQRRPGSHDSNRSHVSFSRNLRWQVPRQHASGQSVWHTASGEAQSMLV
jgi:hypothetical protein